MGITKFPDDDRFKIYKVYKKMSMKSVLTQVFATYIVLVNRGYIHQSPQLAPKVLISPEAAPALHRKAL